MAEIETLTVTALLFLWPTVSSRYIFPSHYYNDSDSDSSQYVDIVDSTSVYNKYKQNNRVLILSGDKADDIELITLITVFRKAGLGARFIGIENNCEVNVFKTFYNITVKMNSKIKRLKKELPYEMIVIPGGKCYKHVVGVKKLYDSVIDQDKNMRYVALMSTAGFALPFLEIGLGKQITINQAMKRMFDSLYVINNIPVVHDGHILTSQGPLAAMEFSIYLVELLLGKAIANEVARQLGYKRNFNSIKIVPRFKN